LDNVPDLQRHFQKLRSEINIFTRLATCSILTVLFMSSNNTRRLFTFDDCLRMAEAGILSPAERVELISGEIVVMSPTSPRHGVAVDRTTRAMIRLAGDRAIVRTQGTVVLDRFAAPQPDLALLHPKEDEYLSKNPGAEDILLIIEVADSSLDYDMTVKLGLYAILGIHEYWVADLQNRRLFVHTEPRSDRYSVLRELKPGDSVAPLLLPDCHIPVDLLLP
jgi:Uma2 family endonuclease